VIKMAKTERIYNVPLRRGFIKAKRMKKSKKAITTLKEFLIRHMKCAPDQLRIGRILNMKVWERGIKNPPHHVKITVIKEDDGIVKAELFGFKYEEPVKQLTRKGKEEEPEKKAAPEPEAAEEKPKKKATKKAKKADEEPAGQEADAVSEEAPVAEEATDDSAEAEVEAEEKTAQKAKSEKPAEKPKKPRKTAAKKE
jgi:ribosomal protein L31E